MPGAGYTQNGKPCLPSEVGVVNNPQTKTPNLPERSVHPHGVPAMALQGELASDPETNTETL